ncbi:MAG TPA: STAS/SEC14 domain-containing protein [Polyangium sp.]|nr:STAS/SEC14 domain-containing protein [Polyangium sp.]
MHVDAPLTSSLPQPPQLHLSTEQDLIVLRLEGDYTLDTAKYVQQFVEQSGAVHGYRLNLIDVHKAGTITRDARRYLRERRQSSKVPSAVAVVGASFAVRTLAHAVMRALQLLTNAYVGVDFFADEITARAWIDTQRNQFRTILSIKS